MVNTWKTTVNNIVQVDQSTFDYPRNTTWPDNSSSQGGEPYAPLPSFHVETNPDNEAQNSPGGYPNRFCLAPKSEWFSDQGKVNKILIDMLKNKEAAINSLTREITASYTHAYWIDPNGKVFQVRGDSVTTEDMNKDFNSHSDWISANIDMLVKEYGFKPVEKSTGMFNMPITFDDLINAGWVRVGDAFGTDWGITVSDLSKIPNSVDNLLAQFAPEGSIITVATPGNYGANYTFEWPVKSIQQTVNQIKNRREYYQKQPVMAKVAGSILNIDGCRIYKNPSYKQIENLLNKFREHELRGLIDPESTDFYIWDAYCSNHKPIAEALGLKIYAYSNEVPFLLLANDTTSLQTQIEYAESLKRKLSKQPSYTYLRASKKQAGVQSASVPDYLCDEWKTDQINNDTDEEPYVNHDQRDTSYGYHDSPEDTAFGIGWAKDNTRSVCLLDQLQNPSERNYPPGMPDYSIVFYEAMPMSDGIEKSNPD